MRAMSNFRTSGAGPRRPTALLWDNDGVLVDTEELYFQAGTRPAAPKEWNLKRGAVKAAVAEASAGDPTCASPPVGDDGKRRAAPDLTKLLAGLASRRFSIADEGHFSLQHP